MREDECDTYQCVAAGVGGGIDYATVAFTTDYGTCFFHLRHNVHFAYGCCGIVAPVFFGHVAQTACRGEVGNGWAGCVLEHVVGAGHEGVFFTEHGAVFTNQGEAVHIGVDYDTQIVASFAEEVTNFAEVLLERLGVVGEVAGRFGVEPRHLGYAELSEEFGEDDAAHRVDGVDGHGEVGTADGVDVDEFEFLNHFDVVVAVVLGVATEAVHVDKFKIAAVGFAYHLGGFCGGQEFAFLVEELQCVPLAGVMAGGDDDTAAGAFHRDSQLCGRSRGQSDVHHVETHAHKCTTNYMAYHFA